MANLPIDNTVDGGGAKPLDWNGTSDRDLSVSIKPPSEVVKYATKEAVSQDSEDKFWRSLGFTQSDMIKPKHKGRFYLVVALVAGYFAYKKYKK
jgi:hypothetical protein